MGINILSLFDGMGGLMIALKTLGVNVDTYYASETDKFAILQTKTNFPNVIHLGDVKTVKACNLKKIDLIAFGSPCQGFSHAGQMLNFDDPRSALFFEAVRILNECKQINPDVKFLMENVDMPKKWLKVISEHLGVYPVNINSNLVSAQNRNRWYWTNIKTKQVGLFGEVHSDIPQPNDRGILLKDILENEVDEKCYLSNLPIETKLRKKYSQPQINSDNLIDITTGAPTEQALELKFEGKTNLLMSVNKDNLVVIPCDYRHDEGLRMKSDGKTGTLLGRARNDESCGQLVKINQNIRRLTPTECARLQTIPEWYKWVCSDTQQYKMLGNGWTNDVIVHILSFLKF